jgi:uncharacterized membrane protein
VWRLTQPPGQLKCHPSDTKSFDFQVTEMTENEQAQTESHTRTLLKTFSWRIIATATTITIAYFVFGSINSALKVGGIEFFAKMLIYYCHERVWQRIPRDTVIN